MPIEITYEKVLKRGDKKILIKEIKALEENALPNEYFKGYPYCYLVSDSTKALNRLRIRTHETQLFITDLSVEGIYTPEEFGYRLSWIKQAGQRLYEVNKEIEKRKKTWQGVKTIKI